MAFIDLKKAKNYRDLGGIPTKDGRTVKPCMLIRGTPLRKINKIDAIILKKEYNLKTIIDLRTKKEAEEQPDADFEGITYLHMPILTEAKVGISHEKKAHSIKSLVMMPHMEELYINMVTDNCLDNLVHALKSILLMEEEAFSVVFHCSAGKDRTGILAALILLFLGADRKEALNDYLLTNKVTKSKAKFIYLAMFIIKFNHKFAKKIMMYYIAKESYLESALKSLEKQFGSLENFFNQKLGFNTLQVEQIKNKFLQ